MPFVDLPESLVCFLTRKLLIDPVVTRDGQSYERSAIQRWFDEKKTTSPRTNAVLTDCSIVTNHQLKSEVERFKASLLSEAELIFAIESGDLKTLETKPFMRFCYYETAFRPLNTPAGHLVFRWFRPLLAAVQSNQLPVLKYLVRIGAFDLPTDDDLLHCAGPSSIDMVQFLVNECKLPVDGLNAREQTPLLKIVHDNYDLKYDVVQELLKLGANPNISNDLDGTVFHAESERNIYKLCIDYGADFKAASRHLTSSGESIFHSVRNDIDRFAYFRSMLPENQVIEMVRKPMEDGRTLVHLNTNSVEMLNLLLRPPFSLDAGTVDDDGNTAIHQWSYQSEPNPKTLEILLATKKCDINAANKQGQTALRLLVLTMLQMSVTGCKDDQRLSGIHTLLTAGADPRIVNPDQKTAVCGLCTEDWITLYGLARNKPFESKSAGSAATAASSSDQEPVHRRKRRADADEKTGSASVTSAAADSEFEAFAKAIIGKTVIDAGPADMPSSASAAAAASSVAAANAAGDVRNRPSKKIKA